jgi:hypothetical protein
MSTRRSTKAETIGQLKQLGEFVNQGRSSLEVCEVRLTIWLAPGDRKLQRMVRQHACAFFKGDSFQSVKGDWLRVDKLPIRSKLVFFEGSLPTKGVATYAGFLKGILENSDSCSWEEIRVSHHPIQAAIARHPNELQAACDHFWDALTTAIAPTKRESSCTDLL